MATVSQSLAASASAEHIHLAALLANEPSERLVLIERAIDANPDEPFIYWSALRLCSESSMDIDCPRSRWEQKLTQLDGQNSEIWMQIAVNRHGKGDRQGALAAVKNAAAASESRVYYAETLELAVRGFAASGEFPQWESAFYAFGLAASNLPNYSQSNQLCKIEAASSEEWANTCLQYGITTENQSKTIIGAAIALSVQKQALEALGDLEGAVRIGQRIEAGRTERRLSINEQSKITELVLATNRRVFDAYLNDVGSYGEPAARSRLITEVDRLITENPESICQSAAVLLYNSSAVHGTQRNTDN